MQNAYLKKQEAKGNVLFSLSETEKATVDEATEHYSFNSEDKQRLEDMGPHTFVREKLEGLELVLRRYLKTLPAPNDKAPLLSTLKVLFEHKTSKSDCPPDIEASAIAHLHRQVVKLAEYMLQLEDLVAFGLTAKDLKGIK